MNRISRSKSAKSDFGPPRTGKNVVHVCKSATWTIWERRSAKSATFRTFAIWTSQNRQIRRTRMQKCKSDFCNFFMFRKKWEFHHFLTDGSNPYVFPGQFNDFSVQTLQNALFALFRYLAPPSDPSAPALMFSQVNSMILGAQSALFAKNALFHFFHFGRPKVMRIHRPNKGIRRWSLEWRTFSEKVDFWGTWDTLGPMAVWLAG